VETTDWTNVLGGAYDAAAGIIHRVTSSSSSSSSSILGGKPGNLKAQEDYYENSGFSPVPRETLVDAFKHKLSDVQHSASSAIDSALHRRNATTTSSSIPSESVRKDVSFIKQEELALADTIRDGKIPGSLNDPIGKRVEKALGVDDVGRGRLV